MYGFGYVSNRICDGTSILATGINCQAWSFQYLTDLLLAKTATGNI